MEKPMTVETDLSKHEAICAERYERIKEHLDSLDAKFDHLGASVENFKMEILKIMVGSCITIIGSLIAVAVTILVHGK
jgi:hypothetical protein